jgi:regulator of sigma E protease
MSYLSIVLLLALLILVHEVGHFAAAVRLGIPVERFSVGFGPKVWGFRRRGIEYRISAVPLGGYVLPAVDDIHEFLRVPWMRRMLFSLAGPAANVALAALLFMVLGAAAGDISLYGLLVAPFVQTGELMLGIVGALPKLFTRPDSLSGVVGIVAMGSDFVGSDLIRALQFTAFLSVNFAVFNLLPIPALDGGKIALYLLEKIHPKAVRLHVPLTIAGLLFVLGLILYATALDIGRMVT